MLVSDKEISWDSHLFHDKSRLDVWLKYVKSEGRIGAESVMNTRLDSAKRAWKYSLCSCRSIELDDLDFDRKIIRRFIVGLPVELRKHHCIGTNCFCFRND